mmetsp:Transcript_21432/g.61224  ORF Transcript_21432/g.61224 Transcript_21432/m.61224 type:complete len:254 (+) Transcript_21432:817-1578(+)
MIRLPILTQRCHPQQRRHRCHHRRAANPRVLAPLHAIVPLITMNCSAWRKRPRHRCRPPGMEVPANLPTPDQYPETVPSAIVSTAIDASPVACNPLEMTVPEMTAWTMMTTLKLPMTCVHRDRAKTRRAAAKIKIKATVAALPHPTTLHQATMLHHGMVAASDQAAKHDRIQMIGSWMMRQHHHPKAAARIIITTTATKNRFHHPGHHPKLRAENHQAVSEDHHHHDIDHLMIQQQQQQQIIRVVRVDHHRDI